VPLNQGQGSGGIAGWEEKPLQARPALGLCPFTQLSSVPGKPFLLFLGLLMALLCVSQVLFLKLVGLLADLASVSHFRVGGSSPFFFGGTVV
jgi:hypothetical protein